MSLSNGSKLCPYEILAPSARAAWGEVYRARDTRLEREVAVKTCLPALAGEKERILQSLRTRRIPRGWQDG